MRRALIRIGLLAALVSLLGVLALKYVFVVREIIVTGNEGIPTEFVISASGMEPGMSMLRLNNEAVKNGVSSLGTHALERMERVWPDAVHLVLRPRMAAAMALCEGGVALLDGDMILMELGSDAPDRDLIYISGLEAGEAVIGQALPVDADKLETCRKLLRALDESGAGAYVSEITLLDSGEAQFILRGGCTAVLENDADLFRQCAWLRALAQDLERRGERGGALQLGHAGSAVLIPADK